MVGEVLLLLQAGGWSATPVGAAVGDTVWVERMVSAPTGWRVRVGKLEATEQVEPLGEPAVVHAAGGWLVRYPVVAWAPGAHTVTVPPIWRLGPDGSVDSVPGGFAAFELRSVIPDSVAQPVPQPAMVPLRSDRRSPLPPLAAGLAAAGLLVAGVRWRRRAPRVVAAPLQVPVEPQVPDARWLVAGEPKAVAARARQRLRAAVAVAVPEAHEALSTVECLAAVGRLRPDAPLRELRDVLGGLDHVAFASAHGVDLVTLGERARSLAAEFAP